MKVVYAPDDNYVGLMLVSITSLLTHNKGATVVVLSEGLSEKNKFAIWCTVEKFGGKLEIIDVSLSGELYRRGFHKYGSYSSYFRLFIPTLIEDKRVVYLDCDTLVTGDVTPLFELDLKGKPYAAAYDFQRVEYRKFIGLSSSDCYYNSGVIVFDTDAWRKENLVDKTISGKFDSKKLWFADQDVLNISLTNRGLALDPSFNYLPHYFMFKNSDDAIRVLGISNKSWYSESIYGVSRRNPVVVHFCGNTLGRPWNAESKHPFRKLYKRYAKEAGVWESIRSDKKLDLLYKVQWLCWLLLPYRLFVFLNEKMYKKFYEMKLVP